MKKQILPISGPLTISETISGNAAFSNAIRVSGGEMLFISGQLAVDKDMKIVGKGDMRLQTRQVLRHIKSALDWAGATPSDIVKVTVFVSDISKFREIHDERLAFFDKDHLPASTMVEVSKFVHPDALIEIEAIAVLKGE
jgi:2-iminobutanoate/2-iminopropanoate deaminase